MNRNALRRVYDFALTFTLDLCIISFNLNGNFGEINKMKVLVMAQLLK